MPECIRQKQNLFRKLNKQVQKKVKKKMMDPIKLPFISWRFHSTFCFAFPFSILKQKHNSTENEVFNRIYFLLFESIYEDPFFPVLFPLNIRQPRYFHITVLIYSYILICITKGSLKLQLLHVNSETFKKKIGHLLKK